jgi:hypothetical protein
VVWTFVTQLKVGKALEFLVDNGQEDVQRLAVSRLPAVQ